MSSYDKIDETIPSITMRLDILAATDPMAASSLIDTDVPAYFTLKCLDI
jgi:hypothetical protein